MKLIRLGVLLNILVLKCWAMTRIELQEFSDFLEKTSQLDLKLKSNPDIEADDDETALDNAWEESGKFEGDLVLNERQRRLIVEDVAEGLSRNGLRDSTKRWPNNEVVYYVQPEHFNEEQLQAIQNGIDDIAQASCVKFRRYHKGDRDAVVIQGSRRGCFSQVGYQGGYQVLNLSGRHPVGRGCFRHGTVVHELLHTLGFYHMQSSPDRDDYIDVIWENILQPARHNFRKYNTFAVSDFGVGYDYESVLHYSKKAFSSNGQDTLVPKQNDADIGQRVGLSQKDTQKLNKMYCDVDSNNDDTGSTISQKKRNQKESLKNKPFEGHGIGYHQGKTVIIKLPAAETHVLPDLSKFYTFDYFSKTSQAVPETNIQNSRFGGRIATSRDMVTHVENKTLKPSISSDDFPYKYDISTIKEAKLSGKNNTSDLTSKENEEIYQSNTEKVKEIKSANEEENNMPRLNIANELKDINKIIKSYVYPSEETGGYKIKNDYSTFSVPKKVVLHDEFDPNNRITRLYESGNQFDSNSGDIKSKSLKPIDSYEEEVDSPFNNPFAVNKMNYFIHKYDPNSLKENLNRRNYYQQLNTQNRQNHPNKNNLNRHIESKMYTDDGDMDSYLMHELHKNAPNYSQQSKWW